MTLIVAPQNGYNMDERGIDMHKHDVDPPAIQSPMKALSIYFLLGQRAMFKNGFPGVQPTLHSGLVGVSSYAATTTRSPSPLGLVASPSTGQPDHTGRHRNPSPCTSM